MCRDELKNFFYYATGNPKRQDSSAGKQSALQQNLLSFE
jgi:hypothetical protein